MAEKLKAPGRKNRELRQANEVLRKASAYFACAQRNSTTWRSTAGSSNDRLH
jgi:transposase-like protein